MMSLIKIINKRYIDFCVDKGIIPRWGYPYKALIEPANFCNFKCPLCPTGNGSLIFKKEMMSFELFKQIIDHVKKYLLEVYLYGFGESLLHPDIFRMAQYLKKNKIQAIISTNASKIESYADAKKIIESGFTKIIIAMDGFSQETYEKYRINGSFEQTKNALIWLKQANKKYNKIAKLVLQFIVMKHNEHEIESVIDFAEKENIKLRLKSVGARKEYQEQYLPVSSSINRYNWDKNKPRSCPFMWQYVTINSDGTMDTCCKDPYREMLIGNIKTDSIIKLWKSPKFNDYRKRYLNGESLPKKCTDCVLSF
jgi:radical SAM protein with 4Fe4S-binding SPASM domain